MNEVLIGACIVVACIALIIALTQIIFVNFHNPKNNPEDKP